MAQRCAWTECVARIVGLLQDQHFLTLSTFLASMHQASHARRLVWRCGWHPLPQTPEKCPMLSCSCFQHHHIGKMWFQIIGFEDLDLFVCPFWQYMQTSPGDAIAVPANPKHCQAKHLVSGTFKNLLEGGSVNGIFAFRCWVVLSLKRPPQRPQSLPHNPVDSSPERSEVANEPGSFQVPQWDFAFARIRIRSTSISYIGFQDKGASGKGGKSLMVVLVVLGVFLFNLSSSSGLPLLLLPLKPPPGPPKPSPGTSPPYH